MSLSVSGGASGLAADLEAMRAAAGALARVGRSTALVGVRVSALGLDSDLVLIAPLDPAGFARVQRHLLPLVAGPCGVAACAGRITLLAGQVASAAVLYAAAEQTATALALRLRDVPPSSRASVQASSSARSRRSCSSLPEWRPRPG